MEQIDMVWVLFCSCLVLFMQAGFSCLEAGLIRAKNTINVVIKNTVDFAISVVGFGLIGFSVMFGPSILGWLGEPFSLLNIASPHIYLVFVFQAMFCATATTILSGAVAERMSFYGYCFVAIFMVLMVYPVVGHWAWGGLLSSSENSGWLTKLGFRDFAGSTVVHSVGGWVALAAVLKLGPRIGRFGPGSSPIEPSSLTLTSLGVFLLWIGWLGFNGGSTLQASETVPLIVANTIVGGVFGIVASLILTRIRYGKPKALDILNGSLGGLVAVTAGCDAVMPWQAAIIGFIGGIVVAYVGLLLEKMRIDDAVGAIPVHLGAGVWGTLAVAVFVAPPEGTSQLGFLGIQALGVGSAAIYVFPLSMLFFYLSGKLVRYRVSEQAEIVGLNIIEHDARTATLDLIRQMSYQATSGEFKQQVVVDAQTEAHHIATFYNAVLDRVNFEEREKDAALEQATWLAQHDPLTGCLNRRTWFEAFGQAITELNDGSSCGLAMLDIDLFKRVNDTYGHTSGDAAIQHVVQKISDQIGDEASLGRFGGEEFVVFLVLTEKAIAEGKPGIEALMEQVRGTLEGSPLEAEEGLIHLTISIGATEYRSGETPGDALQRADDALYAAKAGGRNQVRMA
ncbi:MAG TPA: ammonium transporter [Arenicellales bacterium]|jgi:Amt family ammonium transporter|nr:ammonium transporter [Gammaproteobacteria bacterium]HJP10418.1 ammonium transporter [Arenicellales bacterium]|tara:strand:+ start:8848 stop:10713 length:1866 start_codon:yes stop_codon:yes gene_type:complete